MYFSVRIYICRFKYILASQNMILINVMYIYILCVYLCVSVVTWQLLLISSIHLSFLLWEKVNASPFIPPWDEKKHLVFWRDNQVTNCRASDFCQWGRLMRWQGDILFCRLIFPRRLKRRWLEENEDNYRKWERGDIYVSHSLFV